MKIDKPNILVLFSDTHMASYTGCYGSEKVITPNLDRLAEDGVLFNNAYSQNPLCLPCRQSLLTGLYSFQNGVHHNDHMTDDMYTLAHHLKKAGYDTAALGKMHFIADTESSRDKERNWGFDRRVDYEEFWNYLIEKFDCNPLPGYENDPYDIVHLEQVQHALQAQLVKTEEKPQEIREKGFPRTGTLPHECHQEAFVLREWEKYLSEKRKNPFIAFVSFQSPHPPHLPPENFLAMYEDVEAPPLMDFDENISMHPVWKERARKMSAEEQKEFFRYYAAFISYTDWCCGEALRMLEESGEADNTLVIYLSDHGDMACAHGMKGKICFFEESARVPLIIKLPGGKNPGKKYKELVELVDLFPTFCDAAGIKAPENLPGISLWQDLQNGTDSGKEYVFSEVYRMPGRTSWWPDDYPDSFSMIMNKQYKLIDYGKYIDLFNITNDPENNINLAQNPEYEYIRSNLISRINDLKKS